MRAELVVAVVTLALVYCVLSARGSHAAVQMSDDDTRCLRFFGLHVTRHARRRRRRSLFDVVDGMPAQLDALPGGKAGLKEEQAAMWRAQLDEARCLLHRSRDPELADAFLAASEKIEPLLVRFERRDNRTAPTSSSAAAPGRRLGRWASAIASAKAAVAASSAAEGTATSAGLASSTRRVTRGLGVFAGTDFPCDHDRDAFVGAPWARGACLLKCSAGSSSNAPRCANAIAVCERLAQCSTIDINVEGSVATLKQESVLSARTSRVKHVAVTHSRGDRAAGRDGACANDAAGRQALRLHALAGRETCILDCPKLNCTRGVEMCFDAPACLGVDLSFQIEGHSAVARLRFSPAQ